jgi:hypothetical protein
VYKNIFETVVRNLYMQSKTLKEEGFTCWIKFNQENKEELKKILPQITGVYVIKCKKLFGRFNGKSDIVYIGSASSQSNLKKRILQYFSPGRTQITNLRINKLINKVDDLSIAFLCSTNANEYESCLLKRYEKDHGELPPANRRK